MISSFARIWHSAIVALWFIPACVVAAAVALAVALTVLDPAVDEWLTSLFSPVFGISADGARAILTSVATAMLSVAALVFSITMVTLSLASNQFTSRVLRTFTRDRGTQWVMGAFLGVFAYCVIVLRGIREATEQEPAFVPSLAVLLGIVFALVGLGLLVYYIQHISTLIQASEIVAAVTHDTLEAVRNQIREQAAQGGMRLERPREVTRVAAARSGYLRGIERKRLLSLAAERDILVRVPVLVGAFVTPGDVVFETWRRDGRGGDGHRGQGELDGRLRRTLTLAASGDVYQDPRFGVRQLVDVALKALSPGINDPTTAVTCVDHLVVVLAEAQALEAGETVLTDKRGVTRLGLLRVGFDQLLSLAFDQLTRHASGHPVVLQRELAALARLSSEGERRGVGNGPLREQVHRVLEVAGGLELVSDRRSIEAQAQRLLERLDGRGDEWLAA